MWVLVSVNLLMVVKDHKTQMPARPQERSTAVNRVRVGITCATESGEDKPADEGPLEQTEAITHPDRCVHTA
jgi:hypothetical protein